ncbi:hypothetical protein, partial [Rhodopseudomonas sp. AAP120]|uniref:hypothetical protein n=1 Tax=Rhodopseudomonas sp. AAP120 TaxID=1523430 RepID=UPI001AEC6F91
DRPDVAMRLGTFKLCFGHSMSILVGAAHRAAKPAAGYCGKAPCSSWKLWANLAAPDREGRLDVQIRTLM